jgi:hypothetical protein
VTEQFLHGADVGAGFEQVGGEAVAEGVQEAGFSMRAARSASFTLRCNVS